MDTHLLEYFKPGDLDGLVLDKFLVDVFKPKIGHEKDIVVFAFLATQRGSAEKLSGFIAQGSFDFVAVEASSTPDEDENYIVFVEKYRNREMFDIMDSILKHIAYLVSIEKWRFRPYSHSEFLDWNRENFVKTVPQHPGEYYSQETSLRKIDETDSLNPNLESARFDHQLAKEDNEQQIIGDNRSYIKALQTQIQVIIKDNQHLAQRIESLKSDRQHLYQQLDLYQKHEQVALLREQKDYRRLMDLEHRLALLTPPDRMNTEIVIPASSTPVTKAKLEPSDTPAEISEATDGSYENNKQQPLKDGTISAPADSSHTTESIKVQTAPLEEGSPGTAPVAGSEMPTYAVEIAEASKEEAVMWGSENLEGEATSEFATAEEKDEGELQEDVIITEQPADEKAASDREPVSGRGLQYPKQPATDSSTETISPEGQSAGASTASRPAAGVTEGSPKNKAAKENFALGSAAFESKEYHKAIEYFTKVTELSPRARRSFLNLAVLYFRLKNYEAARKHAQRALDLGAESANRILAKIEEKQAIGTDASVPDEFTESPTEEAIIWGADDFDENVIDQKVSGDGESSEIADEQDVIIFGQTAEDRQDKDWQPISQAEDDDSTSPEDEPSTETIVMDSEAFQSLESQMPPTSETQTALEPETAKVYFSRGLKAFEQKDYQKAIDCFTKVTELLPNARRSFIRLAALHYRLKDYDTARAHAQRAVDLGSASAERILEKIDAKKSLGFDKSPDTEFADTVSEIPLIDDFDTQEAEPAKKSSSPETDSETFSKGGEAKTYFTRGIKAFEQKKYQQAIENFTRVTELLPKAPRSFLRLAVLHYRLKDYEKARTYAQQALELGSDSAQQIMEKIEIKQSTGSDAPSSERIIDTLPEFPTLGSNHSDAAAHTQSADEQDVKVSGTPAELMEDTDQEPSARSDLQSSKPSEMESYTETILMEADTLISSDDSHTPASSAGVSTKRDPVSDYFDLGLAAIEQESYRKAIECFTKVTELLPEAPPSFLNLANLYLKLKDYETARKHAQHALDLGSSSAIDILEKVKENQAASSGIS